MPPIVGVPCLAMWCSGPRSSLPRIGWPRPRVRNSEISARVANSDTMPPTTPAIMMAIMRPPSDRTSAGDDAVVERRCTSVADRLRLSWPLPAMITMSPGSARAIARRIASARSSWTSTRRAIVVGDAGEDLVDDVGGLLGAGVVGGHDHEVGEPCRRAPISGRFWRSRSPPAPNTTITRPRSPTQRHQRRRSPPRDRQGCGRSRRSRRSAAAAAPPVTRSNRPGTGSTLRQAVDDRLDGDARSPPRWSPRRARSSR